MNQRLMLFATSAVLGLIFSVVGVSLLSQEAEARPATVPTFAEVIPSNPKLAAIYTKNRSSAWAKDEQRKSKVLSQVRDLAKSKSLKSAEDFFRAAELLSVSDNPDDLLMSHDLALAALANAEPRAKSIAVSSLEKFLDETGYNVKPNTFAYARNAVSKAPTPIQAAVAPGMRPTLQ